MHQRPQLVVCSILLLAPGVARAAETTIDLAAIRAHAAFLADDLLRGRETGSEGHEIAARYAATRFEQYGLAPGAGESYLQRFPLGESRVEAATLAIRTDPGTVALAPLDDFVMTGSVVSPRTDLEAPVVFAGYGIDAPQLGHRDYQALDVAGRIVVVLSGAPESFPTDLRAHHSSRRLKAELAEAHGAVGLLTIRTRVDEARVPWERIRVYAERPRTAWVAPDGEVQDAFPGLAFGAARSQAGATELCTAAGLSLDALLDAAERDEALPAELPVRIVARSENRIARIESANVVARLPGSDPALAGEHVVFTAHLDHIGVGPEVRGDTIYNGFYDNALGSAILLEVARALAAAPERPRRSILFVLVTAEERGLLGSDYFAHYPTVPADSLVADVNVDMPMLFAPTADLIAFGAEHSTLGVPTERAAAAHGFALIPDPMPQEVVFVRSDQYSFVRRGVPSIMLSAGPGTVGGGDTQAKAVATFLAEHYHRPSDELALEADWESVSRLASTAVDLVRAIGQSDARPTWNRDDFFGDTFGGGAR